MRRLPFVLLLAACGSTTVGFRWDEVQGVEWILVTIGQAPVLPGTEISLKFDVGRLYGQAVNRYGAQYERTEETLQIDTVASTKRFLDEPPGAMEQEKHYLEALGSVDGWQFASGWLRLTHEGQVLLSFKREGSESRD